MKTDMSSLELNYLLKEFQPLMSAKLEQVYQIGKEELVLQLHVPSTGKRILRIILGKLMYLASNKGDVPEKPSGFCLYLRKKLKNTRLRQLNQLGFERIVEFLFETKDATFRLIIELFSKGNIILCDDNYTILSVMERQEWKDRSIKPKEPYKYPKKELNFLTLKKEELTNLLHKSNKESLVKTLALDLGLGGIYAEEICLLSKTDKNLKSPSLSGKEIDSIYDAIENIRSRELSPMIIYEDAEKKKIKDITPFPLEFYSSYASEKSESMNAAFDSILTKKTEAKAVETAEKTAKTRIDKVNEMISQQRQRIEGLEVSEKENQRKAEIIYENYTELNKLLEEIKELKKKLPWQDIKKKLKDNKMIKDLDTKTGEITLEM